ncbi:hypothetical protein [Allopusillimonas ginsengisoli]|uniref:hypothetical protein n=1 Tax=Allopusillimonas ginsengisoli TaxID=453575 RepID=UPI00101EF0EA|nr:hypothetical protein [Allopusillimonas ginsengisoli]TEA77016.1 hypothetical protein ERE07_16915 [Allopusillimonas ginsengisoli]
MYRFLWLAAYIGAVSGFDMAQIVFADANRYIAPDTGAVLKIIRNPNPLMTTRQAHHVTLPELCPASHNPGPGSSLCIRYRSRGAFLEVFSLAGYIRAFIGHPVVRDVEMLAQVVARDCAQALGHKVKVTAVFELPALGQRVNTTVVGRPAC